MKELVIFQLKQLVKQNNYNVKKVHEIIVDIISNKDLTDKYVYNYLFQHMEIICSGYADIILEELKRSGRYEEA